MYLNLSALAKQYLAVEAKSAASETMFNIAGTMTPCERNWLQPETIGQLLYIISIVKIIKKNIVLMRLLVNSIQERNREMHNKHQMNNNRFILHMRINGNKMILNI